MHELVRQHLEEFLHNLADPRIPRAFHEHLAACGECRDELRRMQDHSGLLKSLRTSDEVEPAPGFYGRVMGRIESRRSASTWTLFLEPVFGRRLVFACLAVVVLLGTYMVSTEPQTNLTASSPEVLMAVEPHPYEVSGTDRQQDRDRVLLTLASYQE